jgi:transcriptional regulator with XRE-family HTH domain
MKKKYSLLVRLGENVRMARRKLGLSQEDLALQANLDRTYIGGIERGERNVAVINLCKMARVLGIQPGRLLKGLAHEPTA